MHNQWDIMQKSMNKKKTEALLNLQYTSISDFKMFEAKILFENIQELSKGKLKESAQMLYNWENAIISVYDETRRALGVIDDLEKMKDELFSLMQQQNKQKKEYEIIKVEKEKIIKQRIALDSKCYNLHEIYQQISIPNGDWKGIDEWKNKLTKVKEKQKTLAGDMLFVAGILTFCGGFPANSREKIKKEWTKVFNQQNIQLSENPQASLLIGNPAQLADWLQKGLLTDEFCKENALIMNHSNKWPLVIDPEGAANRWLGGRKKIKATSQHVYDNLLVEMALGGEIVLDDIPETLDDNILELLDIPKKRQAKGKFKIRDGKEIDIALSFGFTLRTSHWNPIFSDDLWYTANIVNFSLHPKAIQNLFAIEYGVVTAASEITDLILEKPDPLIREQADKFNVLLNQLNILNLSRIDEEDQKGIKDKIYDTLKILIEIEKRMVENKGQIPKENLDKLNAILPVCARASIIYQCASTLTTINPTYLFSFENMKEQFCSMLRANLGGQAKWLNMLTANILTEMEKSMMLSDYMLFAFYLAACISIEAKDISIEEWLVFLYGSEYTESKGYVNLLKNPNPKKISDANWNLLSYLEKIVDQNNPFLGISQEIIAHFHEWVLWFNDMNPYLAVIPGVYQKAFCKPIQRLLLIRVLSPEKVVECREACTAAVIGDFYLKVKHPKISELYSETRINRPLLIIKEESEDPTIQVLNLEDNLTKGETYTLSTDTEIIIKNAIENGKKMSDKAESKFIFVRDIQTVPEFNRFLIEKIREFSIPSSELNEKFRLIFSCNSCRLPRYLLQNTIRLTYQSTKTMKEKVRNDLLSFQQQENAALSIPANKEKFSPQYRRLALSLSFLHVVAEKHNIFGKYAWTKIFKITKGEIDAACALILYTLDTPKGHTIPWNDMRKILEEVSLGGKMTEDYDQKSLGCLIETYINEDVAQGNYEFKKISPYKIPSFNSFTDLLTYVEKLPDEDDYIICNMNSDITLFGQRRETDNILISLQCLDPRKNRPPQEKIDVTKEMLRVEEAIRLIMKEIPEQGLLKEDINPIVMEIHKGVLYGVNMFLLQEMNRYNSLIQKIFNSIEKIKDHLNKGTLMPLRLEKIYYSFAGFSAPEELIGYNWHFSLGEWVLSLKKNIEYIQNWLKVGEIDGYWLRAMLYPKGLLNSLLLTFAQKYDFPVEAMRFATEFTSFNEMSEITENNWQTAYIYDMYLNNAKVNTKSHIIQEFTDNECKQFPGKFKYSKLPVIALKPNIEQKEKAEGFECPVYYLPIRQGKIGTFDNLITKIECPTDLKSQYWIMKGVMITCLNPETIS